MTAHAARAVAGAPARVGSFYRVVRQAWVFLCVAAAADAAFDPRVVGAHQFQRRERLDAWERVYREPGLGDFQPDGILPPDARWPAPFVALDGGCG